MKKRKYTMKKDRKFVSKMGAEKFEITMKGCTLSEFKEAMKTWKRSMENPDLPMVFPKDVIVSSVL